MPGTSLRRQLRCREKQRFPDLNLLTGSYVNLPYPLANGSTVQFLKDNDIYLGNQVEQADSDRCYGVVANEDSSRL